MLMRSPFSEEKVKRVIQSLTKFQENNNVVPLVLLKAIAKDHSSAAPGDYELISQDQMDDVFEKINLDKAVLNLGLEDLSKSLLIESGKNGFRINTHVLIVHSTIKTQQDGSMYNTSINTKELYEGWGWKAESNKSSWLSR